MRFNKKDFFVIFASVVSFLISCGKENEVEREYPQVNTMEVSSISENGATFKAEIYSAGSESIVDHGFVWSTNETDGFGLSIARDERIFLGALTNIGKYSVQIRSTLVKGKTYYVRSFVRTTNYTVYGKVVKFISLGSEGPKILGIEPNSARWGDTIKIRGRNFSHVSTTNRVYFNSFWGIVFSSNDTIIKAMVPHALNIQNSIISVEISGKRNAFDQNPFKLLFPIITDFKPKSARRNEVLTIYGKFNPIINYSNVYLNGIKCTTSLNSKDSIKVIIPNNLNTEYSTIQYISFDLSASSTEQFHLILN